MRVIWTIPVAARPKAWVCGRMFVRFASSIPAGGMDACCEIHFFVFQHCVAIYEVSSINPLNAKLNPICYLLEL
jgi:hypothetical protein